MSGAPRHLAPPMAELCAAFGVALPVLPPPSPTITYVVRRQGWVKIGKTRRGVEERIKALNYSNSKRTVACPEGMDRSVPVCEVLSIERDVEEELHQRYAQLRVRGEWFLADPTMLGEIERDYVGQAVPA